MTSFSCASLYQDPKGLSRLSFFSVIHPALVAALAPEKLQFSELPKKEPLTRVEYRSSPLKGTEVRDRKVLGLELYATAADETFYSGQDKAGHAQPLPATLQGNIQSAKNKSKSPLYEHMGVTSEQSEQKESVDLQLQHDNGLGRTRDRYSQSPALGTSPSEGWLDPEITGSITKPERNTEQASSHLNPKLSTKGIWKSMIDGVKRTIDVLKVKTSSESSRPAEQPKDKDIVDDGYTEGELTQLVDDIMRNIQMHSEEATVHREMLKNNNRWHANGDITSGNEYGRETMVPIRNKLLVDPEVLAAVLAKSAKKLVLSKNRQPSTKSTSDLLANIQVRLAKVLKPSAHA